MGLLHHYALHIEAPHHIHTRAPHHLHAGAPHHIHIGAPHHIHAVARVPLQRRAPQVHHLKQRANKRVGASNSKQAPPQL